MCLQPNCKKQSNFKKSLKLLCIDLQGKLWQLLLFERLLYTQQLNLLIKPEQKRSSKNKIVKKKFDELNIYDIKQKQRYKTRMLVDLSKNFRKITLFTNRQPKKAFSQSKICMYQFAEDWHLFFFVLKFYNLFLQTDFVLHKFKKKKKYVT